MFQMKSPTRSALVPLLLLWLAVHAVLLAVLLGLKFLLTKSAFVAVLLVAGAVFLFARFRAMPRNLSQTA